MPPSARLDVLLVPQDLVRPERHGPALIAALVERGAIRSDGAPGPSAPAWCAGGFARVVLDRPGRTTLYANAQGGFRVTCPDTGVPIVAAFAAALASWRGGGSRSVACPCGRTHALEELAFAPPAAFGPWAVVTVDAGSTALTEAGLALAQAHLGRATVVLRRG